MYVMVDLVSVLLLYTNIITLRTCVIPVLSSKQYRVQQQKHNSRMLPALLACTTLVYGTVLKTSRRNKLEQISNLI